MTEINFSDEVQKKIKEIKPKCVSRKTRSILKNIAMNNQPIQRQIIENKEELKQHKDIFKGVVPPELNIGINKIAIDLLSIPAGQKRLLLKQKLTESKFINTYINHYGCIDIIKNINDHAKFALVYGFNLVECMMTKIIIVPHTTDLNNDNNN
jgi:hypothetical protein